MVHREALDGQLNSVLIKIAWDPGNHDELERLGWEGFIAKHSRYVTYQYGIAKIVAEGARPELESLPEHKQKLAGTILRNYFTNEQIEEYGRKKV